MDAKAAEDPKLLEHFEGLVKKTASRLDRYVEMEFEDICQFLRYKVWKALLSVDPKKLRKRALTSDFSALELRDRYVFSCVANGAKDVLKRKQHHLLFIDDVCGPTDEVSRPGGADELGHENELRYFSEPDLADKVCDVALVPSTLTKVERDIVLLLYLDYNPTEIAAETATPRREVSGAIEQIKEKMADWNPAGLAEAAGEVVGLHPEPHAQPLAA